MSAIVFLALNGYDFEAPEDDFVEMVYDVARSEVEKFDVVLFMRRWSEKGVSVDVQMLRGVEMLDFSFLSRSFVATKITPPITGTQPRGTEP